MSSPTVKTQFLNPSAQAPASPKTPTRASKKTAQLDAPGIPLPDILKEIERGREIQSAISLGIPEGLNRAPPPPPEDQPPGPADLSREELEASTTFLPVERGIKRDFNFKTMTWEKEEITFQIAKGYFARGVTRIAFWLHEIREGDAEPKKMVAKFLDEDFLKPLVGPIKREMYFNDTMAQVVSRRFAGLFNAQRTPKKILMLPMTVVEMVDRPGTPLFLAEPVLKGEFLKHNNNNGGVLTQSQTPQAFSHFSYEASNFSLVVVDIQGVGEVYTDPQIHSLDQREFGLGNQGIVGIQRFIETHNCSGVCLALGLTRIENGKITDPWPDEIVASVMESIPSDADSTDPSKKEGDRNREAVDDYDRLVALAKSDEPEGLVRIISPHFGNAPPVFYDGVKDGLHPGVRAMAAPPMFDPRMGMRPGMPPFPGQGYPMGPRPPQMMFPPMHFPPNFDPHGGGRSPVYFDPTSPHDRSGRAFQPFPQMRYQPPGPYPAQSPFSSGFSSPYHMGPSMSPYADQSPRFQPQFQPQFPAQFRPPPYSAPYR